MENSRRYEIECKAACQIWRGYVLLFDERRSLFTMDMTLAQNTLKLHKYGMLDVDVNHLFVKKDYPRGLGMRTDLIRSELQNLCRLETIVGNIQNKRFIVLRQHDIEDRIEKMTKRGWAKQQTENEHSVNEFNDDFQ